MVTCTEPDCRNRKIKRTILDPQSLEVVHHLCYTHEYLHQDFHGPILDIAAFRDKVFRFIRFELSSPESIRAVFDRIDEITSVVTLGSGFCIAYFKTPSTVEWRLDYTLEKDSSREKLERLRDQLIVRAENNDLWTRTLQDSLADYF